MTHLFRTILLMGLLLTSCQSPERATPADADSAAVENGAAPFAAVTHEGEAAMPGDLAQSLIAEDSLWSEALRIHYDAIVFDGHIDVPMLIAGEGYNFTERHTADASHVDVPRMFEGGLDAAFFSVYVPAYLGEGANAVEYAMNLITEVKAQIELQPDSVGLATSANDVRRIVRSGRKAILLGIEGGHVTGGSVDVMRQFYDAGVRYITLTHVNTNSFADASQSPPRHGGPTEEGRELIRAMNYTGMIVDLSHASDSTFYDVLAVSEAPVILSHSSARALVPTVRNASDAMLRALADNGGLLMINFFDPVVNPHLTGEIYTEARRRLQERGQTLRNLWSVVYQIKRERGLPGASLDDVIDHIDHAVEVMGVEHVGLGSDFVGVFDLPDGLQDVTRLPWITYELLKRGYTEGEIYQILGGNMLRVLEEAARAAH